ncbi:hypothetical protein Tco_1202097 [Tanacetum coccineum]
MVETLLVRDKNLRILIHHKDDVFAWWIDSGATCHACKDRCWFDTFHPVQDGFVLHMGDESTKPILGRGNVVLEFSSRKTITLVNVIFTEDLTNPLCMYQSFQCYYMARLGGCYRSLKGIVEKCIVEIQGTFLEKIRNDACNGNKGENAYEHIIKFLDAVGPIKINGLTQDQFRLSIFPVSLTRAAYQWFTKECMGSITTWDSMIEKFIPEFHHLSDHNDDEDIKDEEDPNETNNAPKIFRIEGNLFDFETPLCEAFN